MSDPIAVSILSKLTGWYPFDGSLEDAHGDNSMTESASATYEAGQHGQRAAAGSYGVHTLATPVPITATSGQFTIGGWFDYVVQPGDARPAFGFDFGAFSGTEAFKILIYDADGIILGTWGTGGLGYNVVDPSPASTYHPITVRVRDTIGQTADTDQVIRIGRSGTFAEGNYFIVGTWDAGQRTLYVNSINVATEPPPPTVNKSTMPWITLGRVYSSTEGTNVGCEECFFCTDAVLTQEEITWLYNNGAGRSYADLTAAAA